MGDGPLSVQQTASSLSPEGRGPVTEPTLQQTTSESLSTHGRVWLKPQVRALGEGADREEEVGPYLRRFSVFQAWKEVRLHKTKWLRFEILHRVIQELLVDYYVKIQDTNLTSEDKKVRQER